MGDQWKRWRVYMDELEDLLRWVGQELGNAEADASRSCERFEWPQKQQKQRSFELARRMSDMPFFSELLKDLSGHDLESIEPGRDIGLSDRPINPFDRRKPAPPLSPMALSPPPFDAVPPQRLVTAERALAERTRSLVVVLDHLAVPRNASAVIRTAEGLGLQEVHFVHPRGFMVPQRAVTKRCERWIDLKQSTEALPVMDGLRKRGYKILAADFGPGAVPLEEVPLHDKVAVVMGSEQEGVTPEVRDAADGLFFIPTVGMTAYLNVSVAAAISLSTFDRRMRAEGFRKPLDARDIHTQRVRWYRALARGRPLREAQFMRWLHRPPSPDALMKVVPSREKQRQYEQELGGRS